MKVESLKRMSRVIPYVPTLRTSLTFFHVKQKSKHFMTVSWQFLIQTLYFRGFDDLEVCNTSRADNLTIPWAKKYAAQECLMFFLYGFMTS
jgi:hypothetical protein